MTNLSCFCQKSELNSKNLGYFGVSVIRPTPVKLLVGLRVIFAVIQKGCVYICGAERVYTENKVQTQK